jgi:predicted GNAT family acetyltransferase
MKFELYRDIKVFYRGTYDVLMRHEAQNLILLGNIIIGNDGIDKTDWRDPANWFMATVSGEAGIRLTALMTPPHNLTLYATDNIIDEEALACLIKGIGETGFSVPGVMTEKSLAERFAMMYIAGSVPGNAVKGYTIQKELRLYELTNVNPEIPTIGKIRLAEEKDMSFFPYWLEGFYFDCFGKPASPRPDPELYRYYTGKRKLYVLEHGGTPVSMAQINREIQTVCGIGQVYTPPYFRGKGYASSCVADLSRLILERGFTKCALNTDLANPTSNSIYQKIGYKPVCDSLDIKFE